MNRDPDHDSSHHVVQFEVLARVLVVIVIDYAGL
jgi:hypothetical protein